MKIMVSACLMGENCKYNGGNNQNEKVLKLMAGNEVIAVCPEQMGGNEGFLPEFYERHGFSREQEVILMGME